MTRDTTHASKAGLGDQDGDGTIELVTSQKDGLLLAFDAKPLHKRCPSCPADQNLTAANPYGKFIPPTLNLFGNRDFDKANWLNFGQALSRERVYQQTLWSRMAGGARQGADPCQLSALHQAETFRHPCIQAASR